MFWSNYLLFLWSRYILQVDLLRFKFGNLRLGLHLLYDRYDSDSLPVIFFNIDINTLFLFLLYMLIEYVFEIIGV